MASIEAPPPGTRMWLGGARAEPALLMCAICSDVFKEVRAAVLRDSALQPLCHRALTSVVRHTGCAQPVFLKACGHTFCRACVCRWLPKSCPTCRTEACELGCVCACSEGCASFASCALTRARARTRRRSDALTPNILAVNCVSELKLHCRFGYLARANDAGDADYDVAPDGCRAEVPWPSLEAHEAACEFRVLRCAREGDAAGSRCGAAFRAREQAAHDAACAGYPRPCALGCGALLLARAQAAHAARVCPEAALRCGRAGCGAWVRRRERAAHDAGAAHAATDRDALAAFTDGVAACGRPDAPLAALARHASAPDADGDATRAALLQLLPFAVVFSSAAADGAAGRPAWGAEAAAAVLAALTAAHAHAGAAEAACRALRYLAPRCADDDDEDGGDGGAKVSDALFAAARAHVRHAGVAQHACAALAALAICRRRRGAAAGLWEKHAHATASAALRAHATHAGAAEAAAALLACIHWPAQCEAGGRGAAAEALVAAMRAHAGAAPVQVQACRALSVFAVSHQNAVRAVALGAVEAVCYALRAHTSDAAAQESALHALGNLVSDAAAAQRAHAAAGAAAAVAALRAHGACAPVQQYGCGALSDMAEHCEEAAAAAVAAGAVEAVCDALRAHAAAAAVAVCACRALHFMCARRDGDGGADDAAAAAAARAAAAGAAEAVRGAARAHDGHAGVRTFAAAVLAALREKTHHHDAPRAAATDMQPRLAGER
jgi:hypothetical protein